MLCSGNQIFETLVCHIEAEIQTEGIRFEICQILQKCRNIPSERQFKNREITKEMEDDQFVSNLASVIKMQCNPRTSLHEAKSVITDYPLSFVVLFGQWGQIICLSIRNR